MRETEAIPAQSEVQSQGVGHAVVVLEKERVVEGAKIALRIPETSLQIVDCPFKEVLVVVKAQCAANSEFVVPVELETHRLAAGFDGVLAPSVRPGVAVIIAV